MVIIHQRIIKKYEKHINWCQGGFRSGRGVNEQLSIARIITELYHKQQQKKNDDESNKDLLVGFLDMAKAFDTVWRKGAFYKMIQNKYNKKTIKQIMNIYKDTYSRVSINNKQSNVFKTSNGVLQGSILSPMLYAIFINDLIEDLNKSELGVTVPYKTTTDNNHIILDTNKHSILKIACNAFCDDITLFANNAKNMAKLLQICESHANKWGYKFNPTKCEILVWNAGAIKNEERTITNITELKKEKIIQYNQKHKIPKSNILNYLNFKADKMVIPITIYAKNKTHAVIEDENKKITMIQLKHLPDIIIKNFDKKQKYKTGDPEPYQHNWLFVKTTKNDNPFTEINRYCKINNIKINPRNTCKCLGLLWSNKRHNISIFNIDNITKTFRNKYHYKEKMLRNLPYKWYLMNNNTKNNIIQTYLTPNLINFAEALPYNKKNIEEMDNFALKQITNKINIPCDLNTFIYGLRFGSIEYKWSMAKINIIKNNWDQENPTILKGLFLENTSFRTELYNAIERISNYSLDYILNYNDSKELLKKEIKKQYLQKINNQLDKDNNFRICEYKPNTFQD